MTQFSGIWIPLITPFHHGEIDFPAVERLVRHLANAGVAGLVVCGSTGEPAALSESEQLALLDAVLQTAQDRPVMMGLAGNNIAQMLDQLARIQQRPIAGVLVAAPYYIRPSQSALVAYFHTLADASEVPLIVYNIPYRTGVAIEPDTMRDIAKHPRIVALKDCGGDASMTMQLINDGRLAVLTGEDQQILSTLCLGGSGAITAAAHIRPDLYVRIEQRVAAGELGEARSLFYRLLPLIRLLFEEPNPAPLKAALAMMGWVRDEVRMPLQPASAALRERLMPLLKQLDSL